MRLVIEWVRIEESDLDSTMSAPSSDTKEGKHMGSIVLMLDMVTTTTSEGVFLF